MLLFLIISQRSASPYTSLKAKKARKNKYKFKTMMIVLFDIHGILNHHWIFVRQTISQHDVLADFCERIMNNRIGWWKEKSCVLHQDTRWLHIVSHEVLAKHSIPVLHHIFTESWVRWSWEREGELVLL